MIGNIKEIFLPKMVCEKGNFCKIQGMSKDQNYMLHGMLQGSRKYPMSKESKEIKIAIIQ